MTGLSFLDTNVLVYAYDEKSPAKRKIARELLDTGLMGGLVLSSQVLAEFAATMLYKVSPSASPAAVMRALDALAPIRLIVPDGELVRRAVQARVSYGLHFYDSMIVAASERAACARILSEDLNEGQEYFGAIVENPFH